MKRIFFTLTLILLASGTFAQKKKVAAKSTTVDVNTAIREYRFAEAEKQLNTEIAALRRKKQPTLQQEERLSQVHQAMQKLNATERVTFIDSIVIPRAQLFETIQLSSESGSVKSYADFFHVSDSVEGSVFCSQLGDKIYYSKANADGVMRLYSSDFLGSGWSEGEALQGLTNSGNESYPFMMADGTTLYFAAQGEDGLGGYDIYMTRYDADTRTYLAPENIGMPFNSPANDYLYAIDEFFNLGYFATDRNQPQDSVCVYTFIPNATRVVYNPEEMDVSELRKLARIQSIAATQTDSVAVSEARVRLAESKQEQTEAADGDINIVINDDVVYYHLSQFHSEEARKQAKYWVEGQVDLQQTEQQLEELRQQYSATSAAKRGNLTQQVQTLITKRDSLTRLLYQQEKNIRNLENKALGR